MKKPRCGDEYELSVNDESVTLICHKSIGHRGLHEATRGLMAIVQWIDGKSLVEGLKAMDAAKDGTKQSRG